MTLVINDKRIGYKNEKRFVAQYPTLFATGGYWNRKANATPTKVFFGPENRFFYVLPIGHARVSEALRKELELIVEEVYTANLKQQSLKEEAAALQAAVSIETKSIPIVEEKETVDENASPEKVAEEITAMSAESVEEEAPPKKSRRQRRTTSSKEESASNTGSGGVKVKMPNKEDD